MSHLAVGRWTINCLWRLGIAAGMVLSAGLVQSAWAAKFLQCELVVDGSSDPPGDRLDINLFLMPKERTAELEIRAFRVTGEQRQHAEPVKARGVRNRDDQGLFLARAKFTRPADAPVIERKLIIPYADLDLPRGENRLAYEIVVKCDGKASLAQATPLTRVTISDQPRTAMKVPQPAEQLQVQKRQVKAIVLGERTRGGAAAATRPTMEIATKAPAAPTIKTMTVNIPNGFQQDVLPSTPSPALPQPTVNPRDAASLGNQPFVPASTVRSAEDRTVYFATNRAIQKPGAAPAGGTASATPLLDKPAVAPAAVAPAVPTPIQFTATVAGDLTYGSCVVNFPVLTHQKGDLEEPDWWQPRDLSKDFAVEKSTVFDKQAFLKGVGAGDVLLLVHGFNTSFDDCVLRVAQLQYDLEFPGAAVAFSWPSAASISGYQQDADNAGRSTTALADLLRTLIDRNLATVTPDGRHPKLHLIAHSMGNRILLNALYALDDAGYFKPDSKPLGQVILAAPDVGAQMFNNLIPYATDYADQVTYYYCDRDTALAASRTINYYEPVGLLPVFEAGLRTICADGTDTSFIGHGYYSSSPRVLLDIQLQLAAGLAPNQRMPPLATRNKVFGHPHWSFTPTTVVAVDAKP